MLDHWKQVESAANPKAGVGKEKKGKLYILKFHLKKNIVSVQEYISL